MKKETISHLVLIAVLIFLSAFGRLVTNQMAIYNFTAIGASALFSGIVIKDKRLAYLVPLAAMLLSDLFFELFTSIQGFYGISMAVNYGAFILITWIGTQMKKVNTITVLLASIGTGLLYFLISNFGTWAFQDLYPKTGAGLIQCYAAAIPFYRNDVFGSFFLNGIMSNVFYSAFLFAAYHLLQPVFARQEQDSKQLA
ncbi:hypothetical protein MKQ68_08300 [Chitinophaga horti]|uniref:YhhN-like protein n=1 Tax=Chitinophaga horti TaxID=2920382 RepID=A0ABY6J6F4_9BACT|nr:DUF6580 family putative transport protein [Chitinophaga horti]UYQ95095.1 hypothetical protein MKQ68_08300 [Chitinophaga horti]